MGYIVKMGYMSNMSDMELHIPESEPVLESCSRESSGMQPLLYPPQTRYKVYVFCGTCISLVVVPEKCLNHVPESLIGLRTQDCR